MDLKGKVFGRLTVIEFSHKRKIVLKWRCICECGKETTVGSYELSAGRTQSCGCLRNERTSKATIKRNTTHGLSHKNEYFIYHDMHRRCYVKSNKRYKNYGGRGIGVCERWHNFECFFEDMKERPSKNHSIDRINTEGNYSPENCKWSTLTEQANNRTNNHYLIIDEIKMTMMEASLKYKINYSKLRSRLQRGWPVERAINE